MKKYENKNLGITLVALVITIVILLILAGISISALTNTGLFKKAKEAKQKTEDASLEQNKILDNYEKEVDQYLPAFTGNTVKEAIQHGRVLNATDNTELLDEKGNKIVIPAGFKVTEDATTVDKGIVIEDATTGATSGSQFVWIPVTKDNDDNDKITKADGTTIEIKLNRYSFNSSTGAESTYSGKYVEEDTNDSSTLKNIEGKSIAKNITNFKNSIKANGGYYIGRYEARTETKRTSSKNALTQITEKGTDQVYNYVTQKKAAEQAQGMYTSNNFTSDLMNSYAWDTATLFLQTCGEEKYSRKTSVNKSLASRGTNSSDYTGTRDTVCNVYDMASNIREWTTETSDNSIYPCVRRGGDYNGRNSSLCTSDRFYNDTSYSGDNYGFRPLLFVGLNS